MKKKLTILLSAVMTASVLAACGTQERNAPTATAEKKPSIKKVASESGNVSITTYDYGNTKLHALLTGDALGDVAYIVEGKDALVGIELPAFTEGLDTWQNCIADLDKPMNDIFLCNHATGASYIKGMKAYGTEGAQESISTGSAYATTQGLHKTFGNDFHGGKDIASINTVVSGEVTVGGIVFHLIDHGESYDLEIPALNAVYTHMLGKTSHSILVSLAQMDSLLDTLEGYQNAGYDMILTSHGGIEGQDAVTEKIAYVKKTKELAQVNGNAADFIAAMKKSFPDYSGENYLEMTAGNLYQ